MAQTTIQHLPDLTGVPANIQKELEFLRKGLYNLLSSQTVTSTTASAPPTIIGYADAVVPTPTGDAAGKQYKLPSTPNPPASLILVQGTIGSVSGNVLRPGVGNDYVLYNETVTFTTAPNAATQWMLAWYRK